MKRSELKNIIKPLVKECITESLLEEGLLSNVISEVMKGMSPVITEVSAPRSVDTIAEAQKATMREAQGAKLKQAKQDRRKLLDAIGNDSYGGVDLFEGTTAAPAQQSPESQAGSPLGGVAPGDPGVDISGILGLGGHKWKSLI
jgi:hypothetical protein|tara:strand:- start:171 stop:602 length:432 start_codon:yes stop_codon:yes gene_type:complete